VNREEFDKPVAVLQFDDVIAAVLRDGVNLDLPCHSLASDKRPLVLKKNDHLLPNMKQILKKGYALILENDPRQGFTGIITKRSLCDYLLQNTTSFLTLAQIEHSLRVIIASAALSTQQMRAAITIDGHPESTKTELHELTFAELRTLLTCEDRWPDFNIGLDRKILAKELETVNRFRNAVMHFHPREEQGQHEEHLKAAEDMNQVLQGVAAQVKRAK